MKVHAQGEGEEILMDEFDHSFVLKSILYYSNAKHSILSMIQLQEEGDQLTFQDTNCTLILPDNCTLYDKSINRLLHLTDFSREGYYIVMITIRSQTVQA